VHSYNNDIELLSAFKSTTNVEVNCISQLPPEIETRLGPKVELANLENFLLRPGLLWLRSFFFASLLSSVDISTKDEHWHKVFVVEAYLATWKMKANKHRLCYELFSTECQIKQILISEIEYQQT